MNRPQSAVFSRCESQAGGCGIASLRIIHSTNTLADAARRCSLGGFDELVYHGANPRIHLHLIFHVKSSAVSFT